LQQKYEDLKVEFMNAVLPVVSEAMDALSGILDKINDWAEKSGGVQITWDGLLSGIELGVGSLVSAAEQHNARENAKEDKKKADELLSEVIMRQDRPLFPFQSPVE